MTDQRGPRHRRTVSWFLPLPATRTSGRFVPLTGVLIAVAAYWCISLLSTLINKWLLSTSEFKFPFPHTITWCQLVFAIIWLNGLRRSQLWPSSTLHWNHTSISMRRLLPLALVYTIMLTANNMSLQYLCVASYQLVKCLSIGFTPMLMYFILSKRPSLLAMAATLLTILGGAIVWMPDAIFTGVGVIYGLVASSSIALYRLYARKLLFRMEYPVIFIYYRCTALAVVIIGIVVVMSGELHGVVNAYFLSSPRFWMITGIQATTGLATALSLLFVIQMANPVTSAAATIIKLFMQNILAALLFGNPIGWQVNIVKFN
ncbi:hypothetical protein BDF22DRAFT_741689 [Syncephalis plumigaleata]|nr:hypothetical protein BDF22DRAFT_741689 [Syncephalis plumigaleata]